jgi:hypothetical protein
MDTKGFATEIYSCNFMILGNHYLRGDKIKIDYVKVYISNLNEWLDFKSFNFNQKPQSKEFQIDYKIPDDIEVILDQERAFKIITGVNIPLKKTGSERISIIQNSFAVINYNKKINYVRGLEDVLYFKYLLILLIQAPLLFDSIEMGCTTKSIKTKAKVFFIQSVPQNFKRGINSFRMLIEFDDIKNKFEDILIFWFEKKSSFKPILDHLLGNYFAPFMYVSDAFLSLARAIEAFHREIISNGSAKVHFEKRVIEVLKKYTTSYNHLLNIKSKLMFAKKIRELRNIHTHANTILDKVSKKNLELHYITEKMRIILSCAFLMEIGLTGKEIKKHMNSSTVFSHLKLKKR